MKELLKTLLATALVAAPLSLAHAQQGTIGNGSVPGTIGGGIPGILPTEDQPQPVEDAAPAPEPVPAQGEAEAPEPAAPAEGEAEAEAQPDVDAPAPEAVPAQGVGEGEAEAEAEPAGEALAPEAVPAQGEAEAEAQPAGEAPVLEAVPEEGEAEAEAPAEEAGAAETDPDTLQPAEPSGNVDEEESHAETPHYPLRKPPEVDWSFEGPFGTYDLAQLQRGLKVYQEACAFCHSLDLVAFRNLRDLGYSEEQVAAFAAQFTVEDGPNEAGENFEREGTPSDYFPSPFPNEQAAAAANNGAVPPDFSLLAKSRAAERGFPTFIFDIFTQYAESGPDYIHALLNGYGEEPPEGVDIQPGNYFNPYYLSGLALAMPPPISDGQVAYPDGSPETVEQYSRDVAAFMMWAAEPHLPERKATGLIVMVFLIIFAVMLYLVKRRVWGDTPH